MSNELGRSRAGPSELPESVLCKPGYVTRNGGTIDEFRVRLRRHVNSVLREGWAARTRLTDGLLNVISDERNLARAWCHARDRGGRAAGSDGVTFDDYDPVVPPWAELREWRDQIRGGTYAPDEDRVCLVPKGGDRGTRPITVLTVRDRVVNRAAVQVLQEVFDRFFDPFSFGGRPSPTTQGALTRGSLPAVATAMTLFDLGYRHWVGEDLRDAFGRVPLAGVMEVLGAYLGVPYAAAHPLTRFVAALLSGASCPGLRQGSPLSMFLLNCYLDHHLDRVWRRRHPEWPLIRYVDDLLVVCRTRAEAVAAHAALAELLKPRAMLPKLGRVEAVRALDPRRRVAWLGFVFHRTRADRLRIGPGRAGWEKLDVALTEPGLEPADGLVRVGHWLTAMAPAYGHCDRAAVYDRLAALLAARGIDDLPTREEVCEHWGAAHARWHRLRHATQHALVAQRLLPATTAAAE